jgi:hypothetical protein
MGLAMVFLQIGTLLSPPLGNSLARFSPNMPFMFWAVLALFGLGCLMFVKENEAVMQPSPEPA